MTSGTRAAMNQIENRIMYVQRDMNKILGKYEVQTPAQLAKLMDEGKLKGSALQIAKYHLRDLGYMMNEYNSLIAKYDTARQAVR
jgi:hypothetical protein